MTTDTVAPARPDTSADQGPADQGSAHRGGFWVGIAATLLMLVGAAAPSPFYPVLQAELGFSQAMSTLIFAVYAVLLLVTLLFTGSLSDHIGRRPVISLGFLVLGISMLVFWHADSVALLLTARVIQGAATGLIMSALAAAVVDFEPKDGRESAAVFNSVFPLAGLATGALFGGVVIETLDQPLVWVFGTLSGVYALVAAGIWLVPETSPRRQGLLTALVPSVGIPQPAKATFWRGAPAVFAGWATGGLYLSLGAPILGRELDTTNHVLQGLVVSALTGTGAVTIFLARRRTAREVTIFGTLSLAVGTALTLLALSQGSLVGFLLGAAVTGTGFGAAFFGVMRSITPTVGPDQRGELFSAVFIVSYLAFGIPAVLAGIVSPEIGLTTTTYIYGAVVIALALTAAGLRRFTTSQ